jgi:hypothetical protein
MLTGLWTVGIKVPDLEAELAFQQQMGSKTILDDTIVFEGESFRIPLLRMGDKYVHIAERMVYEKTLSQPLPYGIVHLVYISDAIERDMERATRSGATCFIGLSEITAGFGRRRVAFLKSPSGYIFEIIEILENRVPPV